jgi:hypothetical protein
MIVRETPTHFICVTQHDHAQLSGWLAAHWGNEDLLVLSGEPQHLRSLLLAAALHDLGWIPLDQSPHWNEKDRRPYSFMDEPLARKIPQYHAGVDFITAADPYAGLLCSMHYASFFPPKALETLGPEAVDYVELEQRRQGNIHLILSAAGRNEQISLAEHDLGLLKLWDHLSLYVALNEPGCAKEDEHPWYRDGFPPTALTPGSEPVRFTAQWLDEVRIALHPFPLRATLSYPLLHRQVAKRDIEIWGFGAAYQQARVLVQNIAFQP